MPHMRFMMDAKRTALMGSPSKHFLPCSLRKVYMSKGAMDSQQPSATMMVARVLPLAISLFSRAATSSTLQGTSGTTTISAPVAQAVLRAMSPQ